MSSAGVCRSRLRHQCGPCQPSSNTYGGQQRRTFFSLRHLLDEIRTCRSSRYVVLGITVATGAYYTHRVLTKKERTKFEENTEFVDDTLVENPEPSLIPQGPNPRTCMLRDVKTMIISSPFLCHSDRILSWLEAY